MKCYYEELGVARDSNDSDIKTAYRKLALRWHPDKNPDCLAEAKERFQLIQQAYEVLSDAHERAWYDNHREQILRGKNSDYSDNSLDVFQYFTSSCFKGYGDDSKGFYTVYRQVFAKLVAEDAEFMDDKEEMSQIPSFGDSQSSYEEVVGPFYAYWQSYCTKKTYTWLCPYDIQEIRDRRILRAIEKDMKKIVQKAKQERNEEIRNLVSFIRKRDRRAQAYKRQLEERAILNRQKQEQNRLEQIRKRQEELQEMRKNHKSHAHEEGYEEQLRQLEQQYGSESDAQEYNTSCEEDEGEAGEENDLYLDDLYCVACNREFKNDKAFANHEASKKHRENVERMKREMQEEEDAYQESEEGEEIDNSSGDDHIDDDASEEPDDVDTNSKNGENLPAAQYADLENLEKNEDVAAPKVIQTKKAKKLNKSNAIPPPQSKSDSESDLEDKTHKELNFTNQVEADGCSDPEDWNQSTKKSARKNKTKSKQGKKSNPAKCPSEPTKEDAPARVTGTGTSTAPLENGDDSATTAHSCATCKSTFSSKNKLFAHLKLTNHSVYIPKAKPLPASDSSGKQKKAKGKKK